MMMVRRLTTYRPGIGLVGEAAAAAEGMVAGVVIAGLFCGQPAANSNIGSIKMAACFISVPPLAFTQQPC